MKIDLSSAEHHAVQEDLQLLEREVSRPTHSVLLNRA